MTQEEKIIRRVHEICERCQETGNWESILYLERLVDEAYADLLLHQAFPWQRN